MATFDKVGVAPKVLGILGKYPDIPYSIVAGEVGVTRERVRQIAKQNGYPSRRLIFNYKVCPICEKFFHSRNLYCSYTCRNEAKRTRVVISCCECGKPVERTPGSMRNKSGKYFCNRSCYGKWISYCYGSYNKLRGNVK